MRKVTVLIARENKVNDARDMVTLNGVLIGQANNGMTIQQTLDGHCPQQSGNRVFAERFVSVLNTHDGGMVTLASPLLAVIHEVSEEFDEDGHPSNYGHPGHYPG